MVKRVYVSDEYLKEVLTLLDKMIQDEKIDKDTYRGFKTRTGNLLNRCQ